MRLLAFYLIFLFVISKAGSMDCELVSELASPNTKVVQFDSDSSSGHGSLSSANTSRGSSQPPSQFSTTPQTTLLQEGLLTPLILPPTGMATPLTRFSPTNFFLPTKGSSVDLSTLPGSPRGYEADNGSFHKRSDSREQSLSRFPRREKTLSPLPQLEENIQANIWGNEKKPSSFMISIFSAIAHEAYKCKEAGSFQTPMKSPLTFLIEMGYGIEDKGNFIIVSKEGDKKVFIAFPGTKWDNLRFSVGSCDSWTRSQYDQAGNALLPHFFSTWIQKPYTGIMALSYMLSVYNFSKMFYFWMNHQDPLLACTVFFSTLLVGTVMCFNIVPKMASSAYMNHIINVYKKVHVEHAAYKKRGCDIYFVGHSFGGQTAQIMAGLFKEAKAVSFSAPGGGLDLALKINAYLHTHDNINIPLPDKQDWMHRIFNYAIKGDPILSLKHQYDLLAIHDEEKQEMGRGLLLHRISEIYKRALGAYLNELHARNLKSGAPY